MCFGFRGKNSKKLRTLEDLAKFIENIKSDGDSDSDDSDTGIDAEPSLFSKLCSGLRKSKDILNRRAFRTFWKGVTDVEMLNLFLKEYANCGLGDYGVRFLWNELKLGTLTTTSHQYAHTMRGLWPCCSSLPLFAV